MSESFAELYEDSLAEMKMQPGSIVEAEVEMIDTEAGIVMVSSPLIKSDGIIAIHEFKNDAGEIAIVVGDTIEVALETFENGLGETHLSYKMAQRQKDLDQLAIAYENNEAVMGKITGKVKGGFTVEINSVRAFLPGSLVDVRPLRDTAHLEGKDLEFRIIKVDKKRNNIVVSRRAVLEAVDTAEREAVLANIEEGQEIKGLIKNLTDYGAFVDLGGVDGLLHITDMSWKRIKHPSEIVNIGEEVNVKVLKFDRERNRVSLGLKQLGEDPWVAIAARYPIGSRLQGKVTNLTDYGCFVEIEEGVEGLVHVSEMDWTNKNVNPKKVVHVGQELEVMVLEIDEDKRRISLGVKQCQENPWDRFANSHAVGDKLAGKIKSITDFGIFIGLEGEIDGLVHLSDISWTESGEQAIREYKKAQEIETVILAIDAERERISLGIKQLEQNAITDFITENPKDTTVIGKIIEISPKRAVIELADQVNGAIALADFEDDKITDLRDHLKEGEDLEARVVGLDGKNQLITLTLRAKDSKRAPSRTRKAAPKTTAAPKSYSSGDGDTAGTTLGDILKEQMENQEDDDNE